MKYIERTKCAITNADDIENLVTYKNFPVFMGCTTAQKDTDIRADMCWGISKSSGFIQLTKLIPLDILYPKAHGSGSVGKLWAEHHRAFAQFIYEFKPNKIFEIGGSHGILAQEYINTPPPPPGQNIRWTILDPNPVPIKDSLATYIKGFFDSNFIYTDPFDAVVHSHVFEHIYYPAEFMSCLKAFIPEGKFLFFSLPNMKVYLQRKYTNCLNFEHTIFITEPYIEYLLAKNGFKILKKYFFKEDHSIFYAAIRDTYIRQQPFPAGLYEQNKMIFLDYVHYYQNLIAEFNKRLAHITNTVYVFGAHIFTQFLICNGLDVSKIQGILDNDTNKQGKRLSGTSLTVYPPQVLKGLQKPVVILKVATYADEIKEDIINNMNNTVIFWE